MKFCARFSLCFLPTTAFDLPTTTMRSMISHKYLFCGQFRVDFEHFTTASISGTTTDSDFSELLPSNDNKQLQPVRFFSQLYGDENFARRFSRKPGWIFSSLESLIVLIATVPHFRRSARRIVLMLDEEDDTAAAIRALKQCHHVTELALQVESEVYKRSDPFDLSSVADAFPFLESLTLTGVYECDGSLDDTNLKSLVIRISDGSSVNSSLIPFHSARTLVRLSIIDADDFTFRGTNPFDNFINLTDLRLVS